MNYKSMKFNKNVGLFYFLSLINVVLVFAKQRNDFTYILFLCVFSLLVLKRIEKEEFLLYSLFIPNKYLQLVALLIFLISKKALITHKIKKDVGFFLCYITIVGIFNCIIYDGLLISTVFQICLFYSIFRLIYILDNSFNYGIFLNAVKDMFFLQVISVILELILYRQFDDYLSGTLISAHYLGVFCICFMIFILKKKVYYSKTMKYFIVILNSILLIASDSKHVWLVFLLSIVLVWTLKKFGVKQIFFGAVTCILLIVIAAIVVASSSWFHNLISDTIFVPYYFDTNYNKKITFFYNTFNLMKSWNGVFGFGVGQYGSQISLTMAKGIIYPWDPSLAKYHYAIAPYQEAIKGIMTEWYVKHGIAQSSMVMGYPLVSFIALFAELGLVGFLMFLGLLNRVSKNGNPIYMVAFFLLSVFDMYFEIPCVFVFLLIMVKLDFSKKKQQAIRMNKISKNHVSSY